MIKQEIMSPEDRIRKSRIRMIMDFPFFGYLSNFLKLVETAKIKTGATDGKHYFFNPEFVSSLSDKELNFLTAHETLHPALGHMWRGQGKNQKVFNMAADYVINGMIKDADPHENTFKMIKGGLYDKRFAGMSTEEVYDILFQEGEDGEGKEPIDDHDVWEDADSESGGNTEADWNGRVVQSAQNAQGKGSVPALFKRLLENLTAPQKNWRQLLAEFVEQEVTDYGFSPPDRRFSDSDIILPDFSETEENVKNLVFAVDTSGSITQEHFTVFLSEVVGCMAQFSGNVKGKLIYCDAQIAQNGVYDLEDAHKSMPVGGGGTDFRPVFDWVDENLENCVGVVYLTDGEGYYPDKPPHYPVLWVLTQKYSVPFGIKTQIEV